MQATRDFSHYVKDLGSGLSRIDLAVEGVSCAGCMSKIERGLSAIPDVTLARVNLTDRRVALEWKRGALDPGLVRQCGRHDPGAARLLSLAVGTDCVAGRRLCRPTLLPLCVPGVAH